MRILTHILTKKRREKIIISKNAKKFQKWCISYKRGNPNLNGMQCHEAVFQGIFLYIPSGQHTKADGIALP